MYCAVRVKSNGTRSHRKPRASSDTISLILASGSVFKPLVHDHWKKPTKPVRAPGFRPGLAA